MTRLRQGLALVGFALALLAVSAESRTLAWVAIEVLSVSLLLRLLDRRPARRQHAPDDPA